MHVVQHKGNIFIHEVNLLIQFAILDYSQLIKSRLDIDLLIVEEKNVYEVVVFSCFADLVITVEILVHAVCQHSFASSSYRDRYMISALVRGLLIFYICLKYFA